MKKSYVIIFSIISLILASCEQESEFNYPLVYTGDVTQITDSSALLSAKISNIGNQKILESGFIWGVHPNDNNGIKIKNEDTDVKTYSLKTNLRLLPGKTYYARAYVKTESNISYGREVSFNSPLGQTDIDTGKWDQVYDGNSERGWCVFIRSSFTINGITYFAFEDDGQFYSYNSTSNSFNHELTNSIFASSDYSVVYEGNAYIFSENSFYRFNPQTKSLYKLASINENESKYWVSGFLIEDNIYIGLGTISGEYSKDFWKYNITSNRWQQVASFPGEYRSYGFSFNINNIGYVGGGYNLIQGQWPYPKFNDLWCYLPEIDDWIQKESLPFENEELYYLQGTNTKDYGYCFYKNKLYEYNPNFDIWEKMADLDINYNLCYPHIFTSSGKIFILEVGSYIDEYSFRLWSYEK